MKEDNTLTNASRNRRAAARLRLRLQTAKTLAKLNSTSKTVRQKRREEKRNAEQKDPEKHVDIERVPRIKKNRLAEPPKATSKFKRRQINKTWLPTHLWHTKRAHMTRPTLPLWRMAIPIRPTEKTYRATHRASSSRGCVAWDTTYHSTIGCLGTKDSLITTLKGLGFHGEGWRGKTCDKWIIGARFADGWIFERDGKVPIAPVDVIWQAKYDENAHTTRDTGHEMELDNAPSEVLQQKVRGRRKKLDHRLFIRVHPSAFRQVWTELLGLAKTQRPEVLLEDLRFEIGSITVAGPGSTEALAGVLRLAPGQEELSHVWSVLKGLNNPAALARNAVLSFETLDPRFYHPPRQQHILRDEKSLQKLSELLVSWPLDASPSPSQIFDYKARFRLSKIMPSQQAINRRRKALLPGQEVEQVQTDPRLPLLLLAHRPVRQNSNTQGHWTVLAPWCAIDPIWRSLMYYPLTTGGTPRFGGLEQTRQTAFEQMTPWYPGDFPGTEAGKAWDRTESENRFDAWMRRPPSRRLAWDQLDLGLGRKGEHGRGWTCDWEYLFTDTDPRSTAATDVIRKTKLNKNDPFDMTQPRYLTQKQRKAAMVAQQTRQEQAARRRNTSSPESDAEQAADLTKATMYFHTTSATASRMLGNFMQPPSEQKPVLATIRIRYLTRGTPKPAARVYMLPRRPQLAQQVFSDETQPSEEAKNAPPSPPSFVSLPVKFQSVVDQNIQPPDLRQRWLLQVSHLHRNGHLIDEIAKPLGCERQNHRGDPVQHKKYPFSTSRTLPMSHIRVFPDKGPADILSRVQGMYGPRPPRLTAQEKLQILQPAAINTADEDIWDKHVPCSYEEDLIGFVTSGGYNLAQGRGTAIGSIWIQRVIEHWQYEDKLDVSAQKAPAHGIDHSHPSSEKDPTSSNVNDNNAKTDTVKGVKANPTNLRKGQKEWQRKLCVVRNAGESIGRLALWELC